MRQSGEVTGLRYQALFKESTIPIQKLSSAYSGTGEAHTNMPEPIFYTMDAPTAIKEAQRYLSTTAAKLQDISKSIQPEFHAQQVLNIGNAIDIYVAWLNSSSEHIRREHEAVVAQLNARIEGLEARNAAVRGHQETSRNHTQMADERGRLIWEAEMGEEVDECVEEHVRLLDNAAVQAYLTAEPNWEPLNHGPLNWGQNGKFKDHLSEYENYVLAMEGYLRDMRGLKDSEIHNWRMVMLGASGESKEAQFLRHGILELAGERGGKTLRLMLLMESVNGVGKEEYKEGMGKWEGRRHDFEGVMGKKSYAEVLKGNG